MRPDLQTFSDERLAAPIMVAVAILWSAAYLLEGCWAIGGEQGDCVLLSCKGLIRGED